MGKPAHSSSLTNCMNQGVKPPGNKGQYKNITEGEIARPRTQPTKNNTTTPAHHHTKNTTIVKTTSPSQNHHHTIYPAHVLSNREDSHPSTSSNQPNQQSQRPTWSLSSTRN
jgi:hypothetical protein